MGRGSQLVICYHRCGVRFLAIDLERTSTRCIITKMITVIETHKPAPAVILKDSYGRAIRDLRVSLTDRCNFRCFYCLPHGEPPIAPKEQMLSYEEIEYVCDIFVELGIEKIRLTGGEPMMRQDIETIIGKLAKLKSKERPHPAGGSRASCAQGLR